MLDKYNDCTPSLSEKAWDLVSKMTEEEKGKMLLGAGIPDFDGANPVIDAIESRVPGAAGGTYEIKRLGIPSLIVADGPRGVNIDPIRANDQDSYYCTAFPIPILLASTWNEDLIALLGGAMGREAAAYGVDVLLAPALNIQRNPLNGRSFEYYAEDPLVSGKLASAMVKGIQANGMAAAVKHFAANNQETNRFSIDVQVTERTMREIYLKGFEIAVKESQPWTIMTSYNSINGSHTSTRQDLLKDILRTEWGFKGVVMTDWFGGYAGACKYGKDNVLEQMNAGNDLLMPGLPEQAASVRKYMESGKLSKAVVDLNVKRIVEWVLRAKSVRNYRSSGEPDLSGNAVLARQVASEGMVLLKNNGVLPCSSLVSPLAVFGLSAYNFISTGTGSAEVNSAYTISLVEGLNHAGFTIDEELQDWYAPIVAKGKAEDVAQRLELGMFAIPERLPELKLEQDLIARKALSCELGIITIGRNAGEGVDRQLDDDFNLAEDELELINAVTEAFHAKGKKVLVILNIGGVIETSSWKNKVDAILLSWQPGQEGGNAVADIISGNVNPSGKLTVTFPRKYEDSPSAKNWPGIPTHDPKMAIYQEGIYVGYRYFSSFKVEPSFVFGYGLSYTTFTYSELDLSHTVFENEMKVTLTIKNTGNTAGKEIVQLYLSAPAVTIDKPVRELKGFVKTKLLEPGESEMLVMTLVPKDLASYLEGRQAWIAEAGTYELAIGASVADLKKKAAFILAQELVAEKVHKAFAILQPINELKATRY